VVSGEQVMSVLRSFNAVRRKLLEFAGKKKAT